MTEKLKSLSSSDYKRWGQKKAKGIGKFVWAGHKLLDGMDFIGEVFADFLGLLDSPYQNVIDAYERHQYHMEMERKEREAKMNKKEQQEEKKLTAIFNEQKTFEETKLEQKVNSDEQSVTDSIADSRSDKSERNDGSHHEPDTAV